MNGALSCVDFVELLPNAPELFIAFPFSSQELIIPKEK
jgi:hypothetical protein